MAGFLRKGRVCGISGKWHLGDSCQPQKGFAFWEVHSKGGGSYYNAPMVKNGKVYKDPRYVTDLITDNALTFLESAKNDADPFYLSVHYTAPHSPWGRKNHPKQLYDDYHDNCAFDSVPHGLKAPEWAEFVSIPVKDEETRRSHLSGYYTAITVMDRNLGRILDWLEANGLRDNTLVCFLSDNGMNMGHHGIFGKGNGTFPQNMFEESVRIPCLMSRPGHVPQERVCAQMLSEYDIMPTLLDYVGLDIPRAEQLPGRSFAPLLQGERQLGHEVIVVCSEYGPVRMVRTEDWKYIHRYPYGPNELYDLKNDPGETQNRAEDPGLHRTLCELRSELEKWFLRYANPELDGSRLAITGRGQNGEVGPKAKGENNFQPLPA